MSTLEGLKPTGDPGVFFKDHDTRKRSEGDKKADRQWIVRQTLGGKTRLSVLGWISEGVKKGDALNKADEYRRNFKWNQNNPESESKPICKSDEEAVKKKLAAEMEAERTLKENRPTFKKLWAAYSKTLNKSLPSDRSRFELHLRDIHDKTPDELVSLDIERIKSRLKKAKMSPQTIKHCLTHIDRIVNYGLSQAPPLCKPLSFKIKKPRFDNQVTEVLNEEQLQSLLTTIDNDLTFDPFTGRAMLLALVTGMRRGALLRLKWSDIDETTGFIILRDAKSNKENKTHRIPLNDGAKDVLSNIPRTSSPYVFPGDNGGQRSDFNRGTRRIKKTAGLPKKFRPLHGLRHHYATTLANAGVELYTLQKLLNHADAKTTQRYAHLSDDKIKQGAAVASNLINRKNNRNVVNLTKS